MSGQMHQTGQTANLAALDERDAKRWRDKAKPHPGDLSQFTKGDHLGLNGMIYRVHKIKTKGMEIRPVRPVEEWERS